MQKNTKRILAIVLAVLVLGLVVLKIFACSLGLGFLCSASAPDSKLTFLDYCQNENGFGPDVQHTVNVLKDLTQEKDCAKAFQILKSKKGLSLNQKSLRSVDPLANLDQLTTLNLSRNEVTDIAALATLKSLHLLKINLNKIDNIGPLQNLAELDWLDISGNPIKDLKPLAGLKKIHVLLLDGTAVESLAPLSGLMELTTQDFFNGFSISKAPLGTTVRKSEENCPRGPAVAKAINDFCVSAD